MPSEVYAVYRACVIIFSSCLSVCVIFFLIYAYVVPHVSGLQCFDAVRWATGRASGL